MAYYAESDERDRIIADLWDLAAFLESSSDVPGPADATVRFSHETAAIRSATPKSTSPPRGFSRWHITRDAAITWLPGSSAPWNIGPSPSPAQRPEIPKDVSRSE
jgi:hypothetical protein